MTKYMAYLVAPNADDKFLYKRDSIEAVKSALAHMGKKWERYKYRFIMEPVIEDRGYGHWINIGLSRIVEAPEDLKFLEGKRLSDVISWIVEKRLKELEAKRLKA